jgi:hypothetical protein
MKRPESSESLPFGYFNYTLMLSYLTTLVKLSGEISLVMARYGAAALCR